jgi:hypothetical protein
MSKKSTRYRWVGLLGILSFISFTAWSGVSGAAEELPIYQLTAKDGRFSP